MTNSVEANLAPQLERGERMSHAHYQGRVENRLAFPVKMRDFSKRPDFIVIDSPADCKPFQWGWADQQ